MHSSRPKILLTGATGYIGGSVLSALLSSNHESIKSSSITCLVRGQDKADALIATYKGRVTATLFRDLDDTDRVIEVASQHDIVLNTLQAFHPSSSAALVKGLAERKKRSGKDVYLIHTSGTSNLADQPITKKYTEDRIFSDSAGDIYDYEKRRSDVQPYDQRITELGVIDAGLESGVKTVVIMSPTIFGIGTGSFNRLSIQVPTLLRFTISSGQAIVIGDGQGYWDHVHIADLARLYENVLAKMLAGGEDLPFGKEGIIFSESGQHTWNELAQGVADAAFEFGKIKTREVRHVSVKEGAEALTEGDELLAELGFASNSRTRADRARSWGWKPSKGAEDWKKHFAEEMKVILEQSA